MEELKAVQPKAIFLLHQNVTVHQGVASLANQLQTSVLVVGTDKKHKSPDFRVSYQWSKEELNQLERILQEIPLDDDEDESRKKEALEKSKLAPEKERDDVPRST